MSSGGGEAGGGDTPVLCEPQSKSSKYNKNFLKQCKTKQSKKEIRKEQNKTKENKRGEWINYLSGTIWPFYSF